MKKDIVGNHISYSFDESFDCWRPSCKLHNEIVLCYLKSIPVDSGLFRTQKQNAKGLVKRVDAWIDSMSPHERLFAGLLG